jgi:hypothetical protein
MGTIVVRIDMPASDGGGSAPTDEQMEQEQEARQKFLDELAPKLEALVNRPPRRAGNIVRIELLGGNEWSTLNRYLLLISTDIGEPDLGLADLVPAGGDAEVLASGSYRSLQQWPEEAV